MIRLSSISRRFGDRLVLDNIGFEVAAGRLTGFVGGNGAGKTTAMRILLGVLAPHEGSVLLHGSPITAKQRAAFGYMPEERGLYPKMGVREQLVYLARLHGLRKREALRSVDALIERLSIERFAGSKLEKLSLGNQQRVQIAASLAHRPLALVLDEPFSGLDPIAVDAVSEVLREVASTGVPVLFSSHQLELVERLCDEIVVIAGGRIGAAGTTDSLRDAHDDRRYELDFAPGRTPDRGQFLRALAQVEGIEIDAATGTIGAPAIGAPPASTASAPAISREGLAGGDADRDPIAATAVDGGTIRFRADTEEAAQSALAQAARFGAVQRFTRVRPSLAQIFREVIR